MALSIIDPMNSGCAILQPPLAATVGRDGRLASLATESPRGFLEAVRPDYGTPATRPLQSGGV